MNPFVTQGNVPGCAQNLSPLFRRIFLPLGLGLAFAAGLQAAPSGGRLLVMNKTDRTLSIIDPVSGQTLDHVPVEGHTGHEVAAAPDGRHAYVPIFGSGGVGSRGTDGQVIRVLNLEQRKTIATIDLGKGMRPHCAVFGPRNGLLYLTTEVDNSVTVVDPGTGKTMGRIPTGQPESHMLAITRDGRRGYTSNVGPGTVSVLDLEAMKTIAIIPLGAAAQRICLSTDDRWAFTADQTKPELIVIDTATNGVSRRLALPGIGYGAAASPDGQWLVIALIGLNKVGIIHLPSQTLA
ncbi:MAG TPA: hypothetical protein VN673_01970, partial [Clostridia bacterium]|nr:hypothetical protein [Clostridia bacterium]